VIEEFHFIHFVRVPSDWLSLSIFVSSHPFRVHAVEDDGMTAPGLTLKRGDVYLNKTVPTQSSADISIANQPPPSMMGLF
jgi:hypothetical protein